MERRTEPGTSELTAVVNRLEKLEKQNRRFKQIGALALILLGSVFLMGQASPPRTVEASEFVLRDADGRMRAWLGTQGDATALALYDKNGLRQIGLSTEANTSDLYFYDKDGLVRAGLVITADAVWLEMHSTDAKAFFEVGRGHTRLDMDGESVSVFLADKAGFEAAVGTANLTTPPTGETHKTSAASVVLFDKDKKVLWKAP